MPGNFNIQKVLVAPLDWGLGHATRCIPIIRDLLQQGYEVCYAAEGAQAALLQQEFPQLSCLPLPGYRVQYSRTKRWLPLKLLLQAPGLIQRINSEHRWLNKVIDVHHIDMVISDNRFGLYSTKVPCIFITHQLTIKAPFGWLEHMLQRINYRYINRFHSCWVPDVAGLPNVAGVLSHPEKLPSIPLRYMGLLCRFRQQSLPVVYDYCIILSGPEPQRSLLETKILSGIAEVKGKVLLVRGKPGTRELPQVPAHVTVYNHLPTDKMQEAILQSAYIVSRSGYTTVMELLSLQKRSILIPTPGQTEQEYLAERLHEQRACFTVSQELFDCARHFEMCRNFHYQLQEYETFGQDFLPQISQINTDGSGHSATICVDL